MPKLVTLSGFLPAASSSSALCAHPSVDQTHSSIANVFFMVAPVMVESIHLPTSAGTVPVFTQERMASTTSRSTPT